MTSKPMVRIGHCSPDAPNVDIRVDGSVAFEDVAFESVTDYAELSAGSHEVTISPHGDDDAVLAATLELEENTRYSALATGMVGDDDLQATVFTDDPGSISDDQAHVRFIHCSPDAPAVDIRVADGGPTLFENVSFREVGEYAPVDAGSYDIEVVPTGSDDVALSLPATTLEGGTAVSAIAVGRLADDSLTAVIAEDAPTMIPADDDD